MVSEPTPTTSVGLGVVPAGGSARAGVATRAVIAAAAVAATNSLLTIRTFCPPRDYSGTRQPRGSLGIRRAAVGQCRTGPASTMCMAAKKRPGELPLNKPAWESEGLCLANCHVTLTI